MINPRGQNNQIILLEPDTHPLVALGPDVEIPGPIADIADLLVFVQMLVEEHFDFGFVDVAHGGGGDGDFVAVRVGAGGGEGVDGGEGGVVGVVDAEGGEVGGVEGFGGGGGGGGGGVGEALVALFGGWVVSGVVRGKASGAMRWAGRWADTAVGGIGG